MVVMLLFSLYIVDLYMTIFVSMMYVMHVILVVTFCSVILTSTLH